MTRGTCTHVRAEVGSLGAPRIECSSRLCVPGIRGVLRVPRPLMLMLVLLVLCVYPADAH